MVTRAQLEALGLGRGAIGHRLRAGRLHRVHRGVYRVGHTAPIPFARELAAVLACGAGAVLSHRSAAYAWGLVSPTDGPVEVTVPAGARRRQPGIVVHRATLARADTTVYRRIRVTGPARTLVDLARDARPAQLERAVEEAERRGLVTRRGLLEALAHSRGRRGAPALRALLDREAGPAFTRSEAEERLLELVRAAGLPPPEHNVRTAGYEVDLLWRAPRLVVEVDGYAYHSSRAAFERDRARDAVLQAAGYRVLRVTWRQLADEPLAVVARLAQALSATPA